MHLFHHVETLTYQVTNSIFAESSRYPLHGHSSNEEHPRCLSIREGKYQVKQHRKTSRVTYSQTIQDVPLLSIEQQTQN